MMSLVNKHGIHTSAAYGAAAQLWTYVQMPAMALGAAVSSMAAQNVGAGKMDRVERIARSGVLYALLFTGLPVVAIYLADPWVLRAFLPGPARRCRSPCTSIRSCCGASSPSASPSSSPASCGPPARSGRPCWR